MKNTKICTVPNFLTILRILLVPVFVYFYIKEEKLISALLIFTCGITDFLDGYIARHCHQVSELGKALDPVADKLLQSAIVICLLISVDHMIWLFLLFAIKEISMLICWIRLKQKGGYMNGALWFGKISTAVFYGATFLLIALPIQNTWISDGLMLITTFFLAISFILYSKTYIQLYRTLQS